MKHHFVLILVVIFGIIAWLHPNRAAKAVAISGITLCLFLH